VSWRFITVLKTPRLSTWSSSAWIPSTLLTTYEYLCKIHFNIIRATTWSDLGGLFLPVCKTNILCEFLFTFVALCLRKILSAGRIINLDFGWAWMISFTHRLHRTRGKSPCYPLNRRLGGPLVWPGQYGGMKNSVVPARNRDMIHGVKAIS
jgi:hypothetical protein